jgi:hypothetical protein
VSHHLLLKQCVFESNNLYWVSAQGKNSYNTFQTANKKLKHCLNFYPLLVFKLLENINLRLSLVLASKVYIQYAEHMVRSRSNIALTADPASPTLCVSLIPPPGYSSIDFIHVTLKEVTGEILIVHVDRK